MGFNGHSQEPQNGHFSYQPEPQQEEKPTVPFAYKVIAIVVVVAMLSTLVFPALVMLGRETPDNCHRGPFGTTHCHTEPIDHAHSIFT